MSHRVALIFGGQGALGRAIVSSFKGAQWRTINVDVAQNSDAAHNILISGVPTAAAASADAERIVSEVSANGARVDAVICVAGGWRGGAVEDNDVFAAVEHMTAFNLFPALTAAHVAARCIAPNGLLVLTGAIAALQPQPGMLGYGLTNVAASKTFDASADLCGIAPLTLDTPSNRAAMPDNDRSTWTPCEVVADKLLEWATGGAEARPPRGSLVRVLTVAKQTEFSTVANF